MAATKQSSPQVSEIYLSSCWNLDLTTLILLLRESKIVVGGSEQSSVSRMGLARDIPIFCWYCTVCSSTK